MSVSSAAADTGPEAPVHLLSRLTLSTLLGVASHFLVFNKGDWHLRAPLLFMAWLSSLPVVFVMEYTFGARSLVGGFWAAVLAVACFTGSLFSSMALYRMTRLRSFPGPRLAKLSKLWHAAKCFDGKNHLLLHELQRQHGDFVRTGPNEITVFHPDALVQLDRPASRTTKSVWYDFLMPDVGITTIRDQAFHDQRRRIWTTAFSARGIPLYEGYIIKHGRRLEALIQAATEGGQSVDFSALAYWFAFDVMGIFALSRSFEMLHKQDWHYVVRNLRRAMSLLGPLSPVPWLAQIGFTFFKQFWLVRDWHSLKRWCRERMFEQMTTEAEGGSIASRLIASAREKGTIEEDHHLLSGEAIVAIVAGSDTVAPSLVFLFYELARHPLQADKLSQELEGIDVTDCRKLEQLSHLNALINETLRLHPAVPTGGYRDAPPEGLTIAGRYIPGGTTIVAPRYSIFRSESCYLQPDKFIPERWSSETHLIKNSRSFLPFAQGRYTCLGKHVAVAELRLVAAILVSKYHIRFAEGEDGSPVETDMRDHFTAAPGKLRLVFSPR